MFTSLHLSDYVSKTPYFHHSFNNFALKPLSLYILCSILNRGKACRVVILYLPELPARPMHKPMEPLGPRGVVDFGRSRSLPQIDDLFLFFFISPLTP